MGELRTFDAIRLGASGHPDVKPGILEKGILLRLRFELDLYVNLRPVKLYEGVDTPLKDKGPAEIDFVVVRENTEGLYAGAGGSLKRGRRTRSRCKSRSTPAGRRALPAMPSSTRKRNRRKDLTLCGKTNVLTYAFDLWERAFHEVGQADYADVKRDYASTRPACDGEEPGVVRRHRDRQHVRRHHDPAP